MAPSNAPSQTHPKNTGTNRHKQAWTPKAYKVCILEGYGVQWCPPKSILPPKQIGKFMSEVLVLGFPDGEGEVVLVVPDKPVPNGGKLF